MYLGEGISVNQKICSPLPYRNDPSPSFVIRVSKKGNLYWRDYGINQDQIGFDALSLVGELLGKGKEEALYDIKSSIDSGNIPKTQLAIPKAVNKALYGGPLKDWEINWWISNLHIYKDLLRFFRICSLQGYWREDKLIWESKPEMPAFFYSDCNKAYRPTAPKGRKHRGVDNRDIVEGWNQLPQTGDHFILQTSLKDVVCFRKMGYIGAAPPSENSLSGIFKRAREINGRFTHKFAMCDDDPAGWAQAALLKELLGWTPIFCPSTKDPSDSISKYGNYFEILNLMGKYNLSKYHI
jgi:hypothetical protein